MNAKSTQSSPATEARPSQARAAERDVALGKPDGPELADPKLSLRATLAEHASDPTHRYHGTGAAHDSRTDVVAGEARQRVRGRHFDGSLRPRQKQTKQRPARDK